MSEPMPGPRIWHFNYERLGRDCTTKHLKGKNFPDGHNHLRSILFTVAAGRNIQPSRNRWIETEGSNSCSKTSRPKVSVQRAILNSFTDVAGFDLFPSLQITKRSTHFENSIVGASR